MKTWTLAILLAALPALPLAAQDPEPKPVPKGSLQIATTGCLKGRVFTATEPPPGTAADTQTGPDVTGRNFRLTGKRAVMDQVKEHNGHLVAVVGLVQASHLGDNVPGKRIGNTRITIGSSPRSSDPVSRQAGMPLTNVVVMDITSLRFVAETCPIAR